MKDRLTGAQIDKDGTVRLDIRSYYRAFPITLKCDICGKFIPWKDFDNGTARRWLETPDSEFTSETYKTLCPKCFDKLGYKERRE